jgi:hypothetical protein
MVETIPVTVIDGDVRDGLKMLAKDSEKSPSEFTFVVIEADEHVQPTGALASFRVRTQADIDEVLDGRPENGLFAVFKGGRLIDSSDRFFGHTVMKDSLN